MRQSAKQHSSRFGIWQNQTSITQATPVETLYLAREPQYFLNEQSHPRISVSSWSGDLLWMPARPGGGGSCLQNANTPSSPVPSGQRRNVSLNESLPYLGPPLRPRSALCCPCSPSCGLHGHARASQPPLYLEQHESLHPQTFRKIRHLMIPSDRRSQGKFRFRPACCQLGGRA